MCYFVKALEYEDGALEQLKRRSRVTTKVQRVMNKARHYTKVAVVILQLAIYDQFGHSLTLCAKEKFAVAWIALCNENYRTFGWHGIWNKGSFMNDVHVFQ